MADRQTILCDRELLGFSFTCVYCSRFDVAGAAGACLKRYTDPSFFKLEWANSELMKAQRAQRDKKARREKVQQESAGVLQI